MPSVDSKKKFVAVEVPGERDMEIFDESTVPLSVHFERAAKLRSHVDSALRRKFNSFPFFYQNSAFPTDRVLQTRGLASFETKLCEATKIKDEGNVLFCAAVKGAVKKSDGKREFERSDLRRSLHNYEMALAIFRFVEILSPNWKTEGIKDEFVKECAYVAKSTQEKEKLDAFYLSCYGNIALVLIHLGHYKVAREACNKMLDLDSNHAKGLLFRALSRLRDPRTGTDAAKIALRDLKRANKSSPRNKLIRKELEKLQDELNAAKEKERIIFRTAAKEWFVHRRKKTVDAQQQESNNYFAFSFAQFVPRITFPWTLVTLLFVRVVVRFVFE